MLRNFSVSAFITLCLLALCTSCADNSFQLEGSLKGGEASTIYLSWRAASGKQDFMASRPVPLADGTFKIEGPMKKPTVIWVFSSGQQLLRAIYVERGDKLTLSGTLQEPYDWQIKGNDVMEELTPWFAANAQALRRGNEKEVNALVGAYVKEHPGERASLFLLLTEFYRKADAKQYDSLLSLFKDEKMLTEMLNACLETDADLPLAPEQSQKIYYMLNPDSIPADTAPASLPTDTITH
ncbi:MAG: DUF4369 domain-containing protein [Bacteroidales bacterium]|nr:DUF4369 domain-containing protein [Bacteroidales bacterium]